MPVRPAPITGPVAAPVVIAMIVAAACLADARVAAATAHFSPRWICFWLGISMFGLSGYMLVIAAALAVAAAFAARRGRDKVLGFRPIDLRERAVFFFVAIAGSGILAQVIKHIAGRSRPKLMDAVGAYHFDLFTWKNSLASFPSGHAATVFAAAVALSLMMPRARALWFGLAVVVAASRVLGGAHYVSDVLAGAALGAFFSLGLARVFARRGMTFRIEGARLRLASEAPSSTLARPASASA